MAGHGTAAYPEIFAMGHDHGAKAQLARDQATVVIALSAEGLTITQIARVVRQMKQKERKHAG